MTPSDVKIVAESIDDFIEVPNGVECLRKAILTLAISGNLVAQDKKESTAEDLYAQIQKERARVDKNNNGHKKRANEVISINREKILFEIPKTWKWVRFSEIASIFNGDSINKYEKEIKYNGARGIPYIATKDVGFDHVINYESGVGIPKTEWKNFKLAPRDSVFVCAEGGSAGRKVAHLEREVFFGNKLYVIHPPFFLDSKYIFYYCLSNEFFGAFQSVMAGLIGGVSIEKFGNLLLPLPPLGEQKRIVKKMNEVMERLDNLEVKKGERDELRTRLARSAMQSLGKGESKIAFERLVELIKSPEDIDELEKALRMLAVFGRLTSNVSKDSDIPKTWKWMKWGDVLSDEKYSMKRGPFGSALRKDYFVPAGVKVYEQYNAIHDIDRERYFVSDEKYKELEAFTVRPGDLIISCSGTLGRVAELHSNSKIGIINQALLKITLNKEIILNDYFILLFRSDFIQDRIYLEALGTAMTNMVNVKTLKTILLPLPPMHEQKRIIKKVEEIMVLINHLKQVVGV